MNKQWLTVNETAKLLGISASTLRRLEENSIVQGFGFRVYYTPGGQRRYLYEEIKQMYLGFSGSFGFGKKPAIVIRDIVEAFSNPISKLGFDLENVIQSLTRLLEKASSKDIPVFMVITEYDETCPASRLWNIKITSTHYLLRSSDSLEIDKRLSHYPFKNIFYTPFISSFFKSPLDNLLRELEIDTVILAGCSTSNCIKATAIDSVQYGYRTIIAKETVGDRLANVNQMNLEDLDSKYADVVTLDQLLTYIESLDLPLKGGNLNE